MLEAINGIVAVPLWSLLLGAVISAITGAVTSWLFARQSSKELSRQIRALARLIQLLGEGDRPAFRLDEKGQLVPVISERVTDRAHASDSIQGEVQRVVAGLPPDSFR